jgi:hypothetical protein
MKASTMISFIDIKKGLARGCSRLMNFKSGDLLLGKFSGVRECVSGHCPLQTPF